MSKKFLIDKNGEEKEAEIIARFTLKEFNKDYVLYTFNEKQNENVKILASTIREEDEKYIFDHIETEEEWNAIKGVIKELSKKGDEENE